MSSTYSPEITCWKSIVTAVAGPAVTRVIVRRSPNSGCLKMISRLPRGSSRFATGVSPAFFPSIQTSAHGTAFRLTVPDGRILSDLLPPPRCPPRVKRCSRSHDSSASACVCPAPASTGPSPSVVPSARPSSEISPGRWGRRLQTHPEKTGKSSVTVLSASTFTVRFTVADAVTNVSTWTSRRNIDDAKRRLTGGTTVQENPRSRRLRLHDDRPCGYRRRRRDRYRRRPALRLRRLGIGKALRAVTPQGDQEDGGRRDKRPGSALGAVEGAGPFVEMHCREVTRLVAGRFRARSQLAARS